MSPITAIKKAGPINFGSTEGPWNHTKRLEQILGTRLNVVGLVDRDPARADRALAIKRNDDSVKAGYEKTEVFPSLAEAVVALKDKTGSEQLHLTVDGFHSTTRGSTTPNRNSDIVLAEAFPQAAHFIEKPISALESEDFQQLDEVAAALKGKITSVGYMLRYLKAVQEMKRIITENNLTIMATMATYLMAYAYAGEDTKTIGYWNKSLEMGPVVGQGTHICDLARYLAPRPLLDTIHVQTVEAADPPGHLSQIKFDVDSLVPPEQRTPRVTNAIWRWENGAVGQFLHGITLHEGDYDCELVVLADGWKLRLVDPYGVAPKLYVRQPGSKAEVQTTFTDDDCYHSEFATLIDVIDGKADRSVILSPYEDAVETYKFTWAIRLAGEADAKKRLG
ncbi:putative oxidoreductase C terminal-domain-containing protein [Naematelia encephala]|uniref:Putative oxidoreductase C terminal-domain-containing protein n=1 Tax=Naematelia encephala TaxID=71784 RepID=A0A1Y2BGP7_9TREE|nr:putative oxidoreductase C terminal-domain-containing protein [Naematelia encephala]